MSSGTRVLITGAKGFIGTHIMDALMRRGYDVLGYDLLDGDDILDSGFAYIVETFKPDWIVHLAGQVFLKPSLEDPKNDAMMNIVGTLNVLEAARKHGCGVVFSSSAAVYGDNFWFDGCSPISPYGVSKFAAERYCMLYYHLHKVPVVVFRFSSVYGKGRKKTSINLIVEKALKNEVIEVTGDGEQTRDFTHVDDVVDAVILAVNGKFPSGVYDIGTGASISINMLLQSIERLLGKRLHVKYVSATVGDPLRNELNVSQARRCGFKAKVSLEEGLTQLIEEMKNAGS